MTDRFIIGTRGSDLALWQAEHIRTNLAAIFPEHEFQIKIIHTTGDQIVDIALSKIGDKGLFTRQIENELLEGSIDLAVHSLKDLQTRQPEGLEIGAVCRRERPNDVFFSRSGGTIDDLPAGATVATGSLRRRSQLLNYRPDLKVVEIRGNVPTRLRKFDESELDGMVLAFAGIHRLGFEERISQIVPFEILLPAVGQGAVAVETREGDERVRGVVEKLDDRETRICITAERAFLRSLEGGCQVPIGALAALEGDEVTLTGFVGSLDGRVAFRESAAGSAGDAEALGVSLADAMIRRGARELLDASRIEAEAASDATM
ncbi:MAG: hydroxymethylbilane synthase [Pyrinomonadaceae bacterium]